LLITYLNPNLGFTGASYKASNWHVIGIELGNRYAYLDGRYITDRRLAALARDELARVEYSQMQFRPLLIYGRDRRRSSQRLEPTPFLVDRPAVASQH
jgi:hypothetical protein